MHVPSSWTPLRVTDHLVAQHEHVQALFEHAIEGGVVEPEAWARFRRELVRQIGTEENLVFPAVRRVQGRPLALAATLMEEHAALLSLLVPKPDLSLATEIRALLRVHEAKEEASNGAYAECDRVLCPSVSTRLALQAASHPPIAVVRHVDGHGTHRTAAAALAGAARCRPGT